MSREEAAAKASYAFMENSTPEMFAADTELARKAYLDDTKVQLAAADAYDAANGVHRVRLDDGTVLRAAHALYDHREDALTCYDHSNGWCCVCGEHEIDIPWFEHAARAVLDAAVKEGQ